MSQSGHNTSIAKHRLGCRLPHESSSVGDGYAANGPVVTYKLSPEELAKYGPAKQASEKKPFALNLTRKRKESGDMGFEKYPVKDKAGKETKEGKAKGTETLTIFQAIKLKEGLIAEVECIEKVLSLELTPGFRLITVNYRDQCKSKLQRITKAFSETVIEI